MNLAEFNIDWFSQPYIVWMFISYAIFLFYDEFPFLNMASEIKDQVHY